MKTIDNTFEIHLDGVKNILTILYKKEDDKQLAPRVNSGFDFDFFNIPNMFSHAFAGMEIFYKTDIKQREQCFNYLVKEIAELRAFLKNDSLTYLDKRISYLDIIEDNVYRIFEKTDEPKPGLKLILNMSNKAIYDMFKQLKVTNLDGKTPIISQSNKELAEFLFNHVEGFEKSSIKTIASELRRDQGLVKEKVIIKPVR